MNDLRPWLDAWDRYRQSPTHFDPAKAMILFMAGSMVVLLLMIALWLARRDARDGVMPVIQVDSSYAEWEEGDE